MHRGLARRAFLASLASAGALAACSGGGSLPVGTARRGAVSVAGNFWLPRAGGLLPVRIVNDTPYASSDVWFYAVGQRTPGNNPWFHLADARTGTLAQCTAGDGGSRGYADYSLNLARDTNDNTILLPPMDGGCRMYVSFKRKLEIPIGANAVPGSPAGWIASDPNYATLFDWWEFVNLPDDPMQGFNANLTQVDMMGVPMSLRVFGSDVPSTGLVAGFRPGARTAISSALRARPAFAGLVLGELRAIAPNHAIDPACSPSGRPRFSDRYFDAYVDKVWAYYTDRKLKAVCTEGTFYGQVDSQGRLRFTCAGQPAFFFTKPTTLQVLANQIFPYCGDALCPPPGNYFAPSEVQGALAPAFNRSTLLASGDELGVATASAGCTRSLANAYKDPHTNYYAKIVHENAIGGKAYAFGNDDNCSASSFIASRRPARVVLTLLEF